MIDAELAALHAYQEKHSACDIQQHPWQAVFGAGFHAGTDQVAERDEALNSMAEMLAQAAAERDAARREVERLGDHIRSLAENLRMSATPEALGSDGRYVDMAISTLEKMLHRPDVLGESQP